MAARQGLALVEGWLCQERGDEEFGLVGRSEIETVGLESCFTLSFGNRRVPTAAIPGSGTSLELTCDCRSQDPSLCQNKLAKIQGKR